MAAYVHWKIFKEYKARTVDKWYKHEPKTVEEKDDITILHDMFNHTDREMSASRPDIVIKNNRNKKCTLIDVVIPSDKKYLHEGFRKIIQV